MSQPKKIVLSGRKTVASKVVLKEWGQVTFEMLRLNKVNQNYGLLSINLQKYFKQKV